ncbi:MAG: MXAN_5187 family protein [Polyangiaceae bacterium]
MMLLSRAWYVVLAIVMAAGLYVVFLAVGQYNRRNSVAMNEELASDSQVIGWQLQIDSRRRLDALLVGAVDKGVQDALVSANGKEPVPRPAKDAAKRALSSIAEKLPADYKEDILFAVDRDGRVVGQSGFDMATEDMELGGYAAVFDALHGFLRDDTWVLGGKMYRVVARPVEFDVTQAPAGAIVGLKTVDPAFAKDIAHRTRANVAFYANGQRVASAIQEGFDSAAMDQVASKLGDLASDKAYTDSGHSEVHNLSDTVGAMYGRLYGDAWDLGGGYAVARTRAVIDGPMGFIKGADDKDKANVNWLLLGAALLGGAFLGIVFTYLEHTVPVGEIARQAAAFKRGELEFFQLPRIRGAFRVIAQDVNAGLERVVEKGGGVARRPADLEQILGPVPAQPAMSAFALPGSGQDRGSQPGIVPPSHVSRPGSAPSSPGGGPRPAPAAPPGPLFPAPAAVTAASAFNAPTPMAQVQAGPVPAPAPRPAPAPPPAAKPPPPAAGARPGPAPPPPPPPPMPPGDESEDEEATMVAAIPAEVLAAATGEHKASEDTAEWMSVYEDFIRTKKQCGEATDGLTFEKFQHTLKKNRDALISRHHCKRVRFSVYVKEGRASLKATPVKD